MSAECSKCGHDLDYYGGCAVCKQRSRVEAAERDNRRLREALEAAADAFETAAEVHHCDYCRADARDARKALAAPPEGTTREEQT